MESHTPSIESLLAHTGFARSIARGLLGRDPRVDDVVQDAWVSAMERPPSTATSERAWLGRVVRNRVTDLWRRDASAKRRREAAPPKSATPSPQEISEREELRQRVIQALMALPESYREPLVLRYYEDLPPRDIAKRLDMPVETVRTRLKRGLTRLRAELDERHGGDRRAWMTAMLPLAGLDAAAATAAATLGAIAMKKWLMAAAALVLIGVSVVVLGDVLGRADGDTSEGALLEAEDDGAEEAPRLIARGPTPEPAEPPAAAPEKPKDANTTTYTVEVVDYGGRPVSGAHVKLVHLVPTLFSVPRFDYGEAHSDANGHAALAIVAPKQGSLELQVSAEGRDDLMPLTFGWKPHDTVVRLERAFVIAGHVVDLIGQPVEGVMVRATGPQGPLPAKTDEHGAFRLHRLANETYELTVTPEGIVHVPGGPTWEVAAGREDVRLQLDIGLTLDVELDGWTEKDAYWKLRVTEFWNEHAGWIDWPVKNGKTRLGGLREGRTYALFWGPTRDGRYAYASHVEPTAGRVVLEVAQGTPLSGKLVFPPDFQAFASSAQVTVTGRGISVDAVYRDGKFLVHGLPPGDYVVTGTALSRQKERATARLEAQPGSTAELRFERE